MKNNKKSILKDRDFIFCCAALGCGAIAAGSMIWVFSHNHKKQDKCNQIAIEQGYSDFNDQYKVDEAKEYTQAYENGELTIYEYTKKIEDIKDYSMDKYMQEYATAEALQEYTELSSPDLVNHIGLGAFFTGFTGVVGIAIAVPYVDKKEEKQKIKNEVKRKKEFEEFSIEEVTEHLTLVNSMADTNNEPKNEL